MDQEIYLLGCLGGKDTHAKQFLTEMSQSVFQQKLTVRERASQLENINYALAETGQSVAEEFVLSEIEKIKNDERLTLQFLLGSMRGFTNCRILLPLSKWILDERNVPENFLKENEKKLQIGDIAVSVFEVVLKNKIGGEFIERKQYTIEERQRIFQRIQMRLNKDSNCKK
jgi:hypothetical protein